MTEGCFCFFFDEYEGPEISHRVEMTEGCFCFFFDVYEGPKISPRVEMTEGCFCLFFDVYEGPEISPISLIVETEMTEEVFMLLSLMFTKAGRFLLASK